MPMMDRVMINFFFIGMSTVAFVKPYCLTSRLISDSLLSASSGVRLLMSNDFTSSLICSNTGSSSWKKDNCIPSRVAPMVCVGLCTCPFLDSLSRLASILLALSTIEMGIPASLAT